jgi:hypothetical protein
VPHVSISDDLTSESWINRPSAPGTERRAECSNVLCPNLLAPSSRPPSYKRRHKCHRKRAAEDHLDSCWGCNFHDSSQPHVGQTNFLLPGPVIFPPTARASNTSDGYVLPRTFTLVTILQ